MSEGQLKGSNGPPSHYVVTFTPSNFALFTMSRGRLPWSKSEEDLLFQVATQNIGTLTQLAVIFKEQNYQERSFEAIRCRLKRMPALALGKSKPQLLLILQC